MWAAALAAVPAVAGAFSKKGSSTPPPPMSLFNAPTFGAYNSGAGASVGGTTGATQADDGSTATGGNTKTALPWLILGGVLLIGGLALAVILKRR